MSASRTTVAGVGLQNAPAPHRGVARGGTVAGRVRLAAQDRRPVPVPWTGDSPGASQGPGVLTRSTAGRRELRLPARRPARLVRGRMPADVRGREATVGGHDRSASDPTSGWRADWLLWQCPAVAGFEPPGDRRCEVGAVRRREGASSRSALAAQLALVRGGAPADVRSQTDPRSLRDWAARRPQRSPGGTRYPRRPATNPQQIPK